MLEIKLIAMLCSAVTSIAWFTLKTGISPMPSSAKACRTIVKLSEQAEFGDIVDLGSGWGTLLFVLARKYPERQIIGYELSYLPYLYSRTYKTLFRLQHITIYRQNFLTADLSSPALIVCYLFPKAMNRLQQRLANQQFSNTLLVSSTFALPNTEPEQSIQLGDLYRTPIYVYRLSSPQAASANKR